MLFSILTLYNNDNTILDNMSYPTTQEVPFDFSNFKILLLARCAELEILYPEPEMFKTILDAWSKTRLDSWQKIYEALLAEYNPLYNYDRFEDIEDIVERDVSRESSGTTADETTGTNSAENTESVTGFNTNTLATKGKTALEGSTGTSSEGSMTGEETVDESETRTHNAHIYGNIGVVTATKMIEEAIELRKTSIYDLIIKEFQREFCLRLY